MRIRPIIFIAAAIGMSAQPALGAIRIHLSAQIPEFCQPTDFIKSASQERTYYLTVECNLDRFGLRFVRDGGVVPVTLVGFDGPADLSPSHGAINVSPRAAGVYRFEVRLPEAEVSGPISVQIDSY